MILGIGTDLCAIGRIEKTIERFSDKFTEKHFSPEEHKIAINKNDPEKIRFIAKRYAAKEACAKALGTGIRGDILLRDIHIQNDDLGKPLITLENGALKQLEKMTPEGYQTKIHLSLSDEKDLAQAFVIIDAEKE